MATSFPAEFDFPVEGVKITLHAPEGGGNYEVESGNLPSKVPPYVRRQVINLQLLENGIKIPETYPGEVTLQVWHKKKEATYKVFLYDDDGKKLGEYSVTGVPDTSRTGFAGYFEINYVEYEFPDPTVGVGP